MKKNFKLVLALVLAAMMVMGSVALAAGPTPNTAAQVQEVPSEFNGGDFSETADSTIEVSGISEGDTAQYFQLIEWDAENNAWKLTTNGNACGVTLDQLINGITEAEATTIGDALTSGGTNMTVTSGTASAEVAPGLYYVLVTPGEDADTVYNPIFVSADYYAGGNTIDASTAMIADSAVAKKSTVPFDKTVNDAVKTKWQDVKPGDVIPYTIDTHIPSFGARYTNPVFTVTDTLSSGLTLEGDVTVKYGSKSTTATNDDVTITKGTPANGWTVDFKADFLKDAANTNIDVKITYSAKVSAVTDNVTYLDNAAKLTFSNKPGETTDKDDITRHYTFSIDGNLLGATEDQTDELIKVACDVSGNPIYESKTTYYGKQVNALDGAEFTLTPVAPTTGDAKTTSSADGGHIQFLGLDAGTYTLQETKAPAGYTKDSRAYTVKIIPHYDDDTSDAPILLSYDVEFYLGEEKLTTSSFTTENDGIKVSKAVHASDSQFIGNTPGAELPSTGGIGTTIFYVGGSLMVLAAAILLITKRRMGVED